MASVTPMEKRYRLMGKVSRTNPSPWIGGVAPKGPATKVIICGGRDFENYPLLERKMDHITYWFDKVEVVLGGEGKRIERSGEWVWIGADQMGLLWAEKNWWDRTFFKPDWYGKGKAAGPIRNRKMAEYVAPRGYCVAFWDGESRGTQSMIDEFLRLNPRNHLRVVRYDSRTRQPKR